MDATRKDAPRGHHSAIKAPLQWLVIVGDDRDSLSAAPQKSHA